MSAAGVGTIGTSQVTALVTQETRATLGVDIEFGASPPTSTTADLIQLAGPAAQFAGAVQPNVIGTSLPTSGTTGEVTILEATAGALEASGLVPNNSATVTYMLATATVDGHPAVNLGYDVNYTAWNGSPEERAKVSEKVYRAITRNHTNFGNYMNDLVKARRADIAAGKNELAFVDDLTRYILNIQDVADLVDVYDRFAPATVFAPADAALFSSFGFADLLNSCPDQNAGGTAAFTRDGSCVWAALGGSAGRSQTHGNSVGFDEDAFDAAGGVQFEFLDRMFAGLAFGYQSATLSNDVFSGNGERFHFGGSLKKEWGNTTLSMSLSGGFGPYDLTHRILTPGGAETARSSPDTSWLAAHARFSHVFDVTDNAYVKPWIDAGIDRQWQGAFRSKTGDAYGIDVGASDATFVSVNPMVEVGGVFDVMGMTTEATVRAGALAIVSGDGWSAKARLHGAGGKGPTFTISDDVDTLFARVGAGITTRVNRNVTVELGFDGLFSAHQQDYAGTARLNVGF